MIKMFKKIQWKISREACFGLPQSRLVPGRMAIKPLWYGDISFVRCFPLKIPLVFLIDTAFSGSKSKFGWSPALAEATLEVCANSLAADWTVTHHRRGLGTTSSIFLGIPHFGGCHPARPPLSGCIVIFPQLPQGCEKCCPSVGPIKHSIEPSSAVFGDFPPFQETPRCFVISETPEWSSIFSWQETHNRPKNKPFWPFWPPSGISFCLGP